MSLSYKEQQRVAEVEEALRPKPSVQVVQEELKRRIATATGHLVGTKVDEMTASRVKRAAEQVLEDSGAYSSTPDVAVTLDPADPSTVNIDFPPPGWPENLGDIL